MFLCSVLFSGRLYLDNYRTSYSLYGRLFPVFRFDPIGTCGSRVTCVRSSFFLSFFRNGCPRILYNRGCCPASQRTEDARLCNFPLVRKKKKDDKHENHTHTRARAQSSKHLKRNIVQRSWVVHKVQGLLSSSEHLPEVCIGPSWTFNPLLNCLILHSGYFTFGTQRLETLSVASDQRQLRTEMWPGDWWHSAKCFLVKVLQIQVSPYILMIGSVIFFRGVC